MKSKVSNRSQSKYKKKQNIVSKDNQKQFNQIMKWSEVLFNHIDLYYPTSDKSSQQYHFNRVEFIDLSQLQMLVSKRKQYIQFSCILFDKNTQSYIGKTYFSEIFEIQYKSMQKPGIISNKSIFFYTDLKSVVLKVDVWRLESEKTGKSVEFICKSIYVGNVQIDLSQSRQTGIIRKTINSSETDRFFNKEDYQTQDLVQSRIKNYPSILTYKIINTHSLAYLHYFIPPHVLIDEFDEIIGLKNGHIGQDQQIKMDEVSCIRINIKEVSVPLVARRPLIEIVQKKIEFNYNLFGRITNNFKQLRLHFQFHNGWKVISNQIIILKQDNNQSILSSKKKTDQKQLSNVKNSSLKTKSNLNRKYYAENEKQLRPVFSQQGCILLVWLEAKVQSKFDVKYGNQRKEKSQITYLPLGFSLLSILDRPSEQTNKIRLIEGNPYNLQHLSKYIYQESGANNYNGSSSDNIIMCQFELNLDQTQFGLPGNMEKHKDEIESLKAQKQRLTHLRRKIKEEKRRKMVQMNQQIPFLQTTHLKQKIFEQKLSRIKGEKQQKQNILLFLKSRVNDLERQALHNQFNNQNNYFNDSDEDPYNQGIKIVQKLPDNFIDYKPQQINNNIDSAIVVHVFSTDYCKKAKNPPKVSSPKIIQQFMMTSTYLNIKIKDFQSYCKQFQQFTILIPNFRGSQEQIEITMINKEASDNKSINIKITAQKEQKTRQIVNLLCNSALPIYLECDHNKKMRGIYLLQCDTLMQSCEQGQILFKSLQKTIQFRQQNTILAKVNLSMSFTQNVNQQKQLASQKSKMISQLIPCADVKSSLMNRINRFKQGKGDDMFKKMEVMEKAVSYLKSQNILIYCKRNREQIIKIKLCNKSNQKQLYTLTILDDDRQYLQKEQLRFITRQQSESMKAGIYLEAKQEIFTQLVYCSNRINFNFANQIKEVEINDANFKKIYNHPHKINVSLVQKNTNVIEQIVEISIAPEFEDNAIFIQKFIGEKEDVIFPVPCRDLVLKNQDQKVKIAPTKLTISVPLLQNSAPYITQFSLMKQPLSDSKTQVIFQSFQFVGWGCQKLEIIGRLWQEIDFLIKIPLSVILKRQASLSYLINSITINSKSMHVKLKCNTQFGYTAQQIISRKNNQIYVRALISLNQIGKNIYGIQVSDQNNVIFYRLGIYCNLPFPTLASHQIINIKIPKDNIDHSQSFLYTNQKGKSINFKAKSLRPNLLRFKDEMKRLQKKGEWKMQLLFDWLNIKSQIIEQQKQQLQILMGIKGDEFIEYVLFKCRISP